VVLLLLRAPPRERDGGALDGNLVLVPRFSVEERRLSNVARLDFSTADPDLLQRHVDDLGQLSTQTVEKVVEAIGVVPREVRRRVEAGLEWLAPLPDLLPCVVDEVADDLASDSSTEELDDDVCNLTPCSEVRGPSTALDREPALRLSADSPIRLVVKPLDAW